MYDIEDYLEGYGMYGGGHGHYGSDSTILGVIFIFCLIAALVIYFTFLNARNEGRFHGFAGWLYEFLSFRKLFLEGFMKVLYICSTLTVIISSFLLIKESFGEFLLMLVGGTVLVRVVYEFILLMIMICKNTGDINRKLGKDQPDPGAAQGPFVDPFAPQQGGQPFQPQQQGQDFQGKPSGSQPVYGGYPQEEQPKVVLQKPVAPGVCPKCGMANDADAVFCVNCGERLQK